MGTQPQQHFDGKIYEESNYCCWEGIKTIFHSPHPRATSAGATLGAPLESHPSLWPAITGTDYSCNSLLIGSGAGTAVNARLQPCLPSPGLPSAPPTTKCCGAVDRDSSSSGCCPGTGQSTQPGSNPRTHLYSVWQTPIQPATPNSNATCSGKPSLMMP